MYKSIIDIIAEFISGLLISLGLKQDKQIIATQIHKNVLVIEHNPILTTQQNKLLSDYFEWNTPRQLVKDFIADLFYASHGIAIYTVADYIVAHDWPIKADGFRYNEQSYLNAKATNQFHDPDAVDYNALLHEFNVLERVASGEIDEVYLMGPPYAGYLESVMGGENSFWCNGGPLAKTIDCPRKFIIMGFNYERGVAEMLHSYGHRAEAILNRAFKDKRYGENLYWTFRQFDKLFPKQAHIGSIHFAPNSERDYDYGNNTEVLSYCDSWLKFPKTFGKPRLIDSSEWGGGMRSHHIWWFQHLPHWIGEFKEMSKNWWKYISDPNEVK